MVHEPVRPDSAVTALPDGVDALRAEVVRLRRTLLKQGHAQELFQERVEANVGRLAQRLGAQGRSDEAPEAVPSAPQLRTLVELDQAVLHLLILAHNGAAPTTTTADPNAPRSLREGLVMLEVRVRNLQRSFGLEPIPARGQPFDDRVHRVCGTCERSDLPDGQVSEEILPGYRLGDRVVRPALVIVNRHRPSQSDADALWSNP